MQRRPKLRGACGASHLPQVASLPALPTVPVVHLYEHIHEHHHFVYRAPAHEVPDPPPAPEEDLPRALPRSQQPKGPKGKARGKRHSKESQEELVIPRIVVEQVPDRPPSKESKDSHEEEPATTEAAADAAGAVPRTASAESFPRWKKACRPKPKPMPKPHMDYLVVADRSRGRDGLESRSSIASSRCLSRQSSAARVKLAKAAQSAQEEDPLALRLKWMEAETLWSELRRDLRRHLRELPDSSKSKAKQKLMGRMVTGTSKDRARLDNQKAKEHEESRELVRHVEEELKACSRSRHKVLRMQELLRRRGVQFFR